MNLKILILGAGYGTRLQRDILQDTSQKYSHLLGIPKALLPVGGQDALITHWLQIFKTANIDVASSVYVVTNDPSYNSFISWADRNSIPRSNIVNDKSTCNEDQLGAVVDLLFGLNYFKLFNNDLLIVGGDTLFLKDFNFNKLLDQFSTFNDGCLVTTYTIPKNEISKYGILTINKLNYDNGLFEVTDFLEKPNPESTNSRNACPCFYLLKSEALPLIEEFLKEAEFKGAKLEDKDATGKFLAWVIKGKHFKFYAVQINGRIDVGDLKSYVEAKEYFGD
ncbi:nucleotide-diphospho-sugar transferase [Gigaspora rosea]|uniref:Nucleotide-diphospho-sugar transferase n=1 Tax=Gigaspora rosea TaxID=44941 RepID=A0A397TTQ4_9GLOM|nr:nucleotide-diphospho-sugar transferase [Gigaspora rosea]